MQIMKAAKTAAILAFLGFTATASAQKVPPPADHNALAAYFIYLVSSKAKLFACRLFLLIFDSLSRMCTSSCTAFDRLAFAEAELSPAIMSRFQMAPTTLQSARLCELFGQSAMRKVLPRISMPPSSSACVLKIQLTM